MTELAIKGEVSPNIKKLAYECYRKGLSIEGYIEHLTNKTELENKHFENYGKNTNKVYRYKDLTMEDIEYLKTNFKKMKLHYDNLSTKKYNDILFKNKQKKNYNNKKNEIIKKYRNEKLEELDNLKDSRFKDDKRYQEWSQCYNKIYQYNRVVPGVNSKGDMRIFIMNQ